MTSLVLHIGSLRTNRSFRMSLKSDPEWDKVSLSALFGYTMPLVWVARGVSLWNSVFSNVNIPLLGFPSSAQWGIHHSLTGPKVGSPSLHAHPEIFLSATHWNLIIHQGLVYFQAPPQGTKQSLHPQGHNSGEFGNSMSWDFNQRTRRRGINQDKVGRKAWNFRDCWALYI